MRDVTGKQITLHSWVVWASRTGTTCFLNEGYVEGWTKDGDPRVRTRKGKRITVWDKRHCATRVAVVGRYFPGDIDNHWRRA